MRRNESLRFRILASFTVVGFLLSLVFGWMAVGILHTVEDSLTENRLKMEGEAFLDQYAQDPETRPMHSRLVKGYIGAENLPPLFRDIPKVQQPGLHEFWDEYHMLALQLPGEDRMFYLIQDNREVEPLDMHHLILGAFVIVLLITLLSSWLGYRLGNRMMAPLRELADEVRSLDPDRLPHDLVGKYYDDEVGEVARGLGNSLGMINQLVERERSFTRNASHELRTPVTVIKGAAELMDRLSAKGKPIHSPLRRVHRAVKDMENIIETFLYLGREGHQSPDQEPFQLGLLARDLIQQNQYLLEEKEVTVELLEEEEDLVLATPQKVTAIALGNLIRNAFQYTDQGRITIEVGRGFAQVSDTGRGMDEATLAKARERDMRAGPGEGFGLGLSIVNDFCKTFGWRLTLESQTGQGVVARLDFGADSR